MVIPFSFHNKWFDMTLIKIVYVDRIFSEQEQESNSF